MFPIFRLFPQILNALALFWRILSLATPIFSDQLVKILLIVVSIFAASRFYSIFARKMTIGISVKNLSILAQDTAKCREWNGDCG